MAVDDGGDGAQVVRLEQDGLEGREALDEAGKLLNAALWRDPGGDLAIEDGNPHAIAPMEASRCQRQGRVQGPVKALQPLDLGGHQATAIEQNQQGLLLLGLQNPDQKRRLILGMGSAGGGFPVD